MGIDTEGLVDVGAFTAGHRAFFGFHRDRVLLQAKVIPPSAVRVMNSARACLANRNEYQPQANQISPSASTTLVPKSEH